MAHGAPPARVGRRRAGLPSAARTMNAPPAAAPRVPGGIPSGAKGDDRAFYTIADRYLDDSFRAYPTQATGAGYHRYDDLLEDLTPEGLRDKLKLATRYRAELSAVDPKRLSVSARIDYDLVQNDLEGTIFM